MSTEKSLVRTVEDLVETVKVIARHFRSDEVFIIGSQSILLSWPDAPVTMRTSGEIDAYPGNARLWEVARKQIDPDDDLRSVKGDRRSLWRRVRISPETWFLH